MSSRLLRLKNRSDFLRAQRAGRKWVTPGLILQARKRDTGEAVAGDRSAVRVGFTVSKKVGNAVVRNRAKRRLRAVAETILTEHAMDHHDYVLIGRAGTRRRNHAALLGDLDISLRKLGAHMTPSASTEASQAGQ